MEFSRAEHKPFKQTEAKELERHAVEASRWNDLLGAASDETTYGDNTMNTQKELLAILYALSLIFDYTLNEEKARIYVDILEDLNMNALRQAAREHMQYGKAFPLPVELRERVEQGQLAALTG